MRAQVILDVILGRFEVPLSFKLRVKFAAGMYNVLFQCGLDDLPEEVFALDSRQAVRDESNASLDALAKTKKTT